MFFFLGIHFFISKVDIIVKREGWIIGNDKTNACLDWERHVAMRGLEGESICDGLCRFLHSGLVIVGNNAHKFITTVLHGNGIDRTLLMNDRSDTADSRIFHIVSEIIIDIFQISDFAFTKMHRSKKIDMCLGKFNSCDRQIKVYGSCCIVEIGHKKIIGDRKSGILRSKTDACGNIVK